MMKRLFLTVLFAHVLWLPASVAQQTTHLQQIYTTQITDGDMKSLETIDVRFMSSLSYDRLLYFFRDRASITQPTGCTNYGGWENSDLKGHTLGHYLTAMSLLYAQTGKAAYKTKITKTVDVLRQMQGGHVWGVWNGSNYGNIELSQTLTEMPNGRWRLTALMMVSGNERNNQARLFLNNSSMLAGTATDFSSLPQSEECTFSGEWNDADNDMHQRFCVEADVNDGTLQFGVRSNGFFKVDDFQLTMLTPLPDGIEKPTADPSFRRGEQSAVYDLQGRHIPTPLLKEGQVENFPPGIYIVNGQKALVK